MSCDLDRSLKGSVHVMKMKGESLNWCIIPQVML